MALWGIAACPWGNNLKGTSLYLSVVIPLRYYSASLVVNKVHLCFFKSTAQSKAVHQNTCFVCTFFFFCKSTIIFQKQCMGQHTYPRHLSMYLCLQFQK